MKRILLILLPLAVVGSLLYARRAQPAGAMREVVRRQPARVFAPRMSIDADYLPCTRIEPPADSTVTRWECGASGDLPLRLTRLATAGESIDPDSLWASALTNVIWWDRELESMFEAIEHLHQALRLSPDSVALLVDLSAVYLVRAERMQNPRDLLEGLNAALQASALDPDNLPALFNAALASEALALDEGAVARWSAYLAADSTSQWADEARQRRATLLALRNLPPRPTASSTKAEVDSFAARDAQRASVVGWDSVLVDWGRAVQKGDSTRADSLLQIARWLGAALEQRKPTGNVTLADAVRAIDTVRMNQAATRRLAEAHVAFGEGQAIFQNEHEKALEFYGRALAVRPPSPVLVIMTRVARVAPMMYLGMDDAAVDTLNALIPQFDSVRYASLTGRVQWLLGTIANRTNSPKAKIFWQRAAETYRRIGEWENHAGVRNLVSWVPYEGGDTIGAYRLAHEVLLQLRTSRGSIRLQSQLTDLAAWSVRDGMERAAIAVQEENFRVAMRFDASSRKIDAYLARVQIGASAGQFQHVGQDLDSATVLVNALQDTIQKKRFQSRLVLARAVAGAGSPRVPSTVALDSAIEAATDQPAWQLLGMMARADINLAANDTASASTDLDAITVQIRTMSQDTSQSPDRFYERSAMIEQLRTRMDRLAMLHLRARRPLQALDAVERGRLSFGPGADGPLRRSGLHTPPVGQVVVAYALIGDTILTWVVRHDSVTLRERRINRDSLLLMIRQMSAMLETAERAHLADPYLRRLHDELIAPVRDRLPPNSTLVIVADGEIAGIPFPAFFDARREKYLVEDHPLRVAASLADASRPDLPVDTAGLRALLVADPAFDQNEHVMLSQLDGADAEVAALRALYPRRVELSDSAATVDSFRAAVTGVHVIHYAGHAVFDDARPERSHLVLADRGERGRFTADSVGSLDLRGVRMVVLSACHTVRARQGRTGGFAGLSGALLEAGAGGVVGSLWQADDELTRPLMVAFHHAYLDGRDPARALQQAQLHMLRSTNRAERSPAAWAGFRYAGR